MSTVVAQHHHIDHPGLVVLIEDHGVRRTGYRFEVIRHAAPGIGPVSAEARDWEAARELANRCWTSGVRQAVEYKAWAASQVAKTSAEIAAKLEATDPFTSDAPAYGDDEAAPVVVAQVTAPVKPLEAGDLCTTLDDDIYRIKRSQTSGGLYAVRLVRPTNEEADAGVKARWEYAPGVIRQLGPEHRMTAEQVADYGRLTGWCANCGKLLTHPVSIERGMGPVCYGRWYDEA